MLTGINSYHLDSKVSEYQPGSLILFSTSGYQWASNFGITPMFEGEQFYWAEDNVFLGQECNQAMVSAINDMIYKIAFRFSIADHQQSNQFRKTVVEYLTNQFGLRFERQNIGYSDLLFWDTSQGNVILELITSSDTAIVLTSSMVRNARKLSRTRSFLARIFGK